MEETDHYCQKKGKKKKNPLFGFLEFLVVLGIIGLELMRIVVGTCCQNPFKGPFWDQPLQDLCREYVSWVYPYFCSCLSQFVGFIVKRWVRSERYRSEALKLLKLFWIVWYVLLTIVEASGDEESVPHSFHNFLPTDNCSVPIDRKSVV